MVLVVVHAAVAVRVEVQSRRSRIHMKLVIQRFEDLVVGHG